MSLDLSLWQLTEPQVLWGLLLLPLLWVLRERSTAGHSPWRSFGAMLGRGLGLSALLLALAQPYVETPRPDRSAVFVVDASASLSPERQERAAAWLEEAWEAKDSVPASILVAGEQVTLTEDLEEALALLSKTAAPRAGSDLRSLVELGLAALPPARHQEIVLLSDGASTHGEIEAVLRVASARDLPVHTAPLGPSELRAGAGKLELEQDRLVGEEVELTVQLSSNAAVEGRRRAHGEGHPYTQLSIGALAQFENASQQEQERDVAADASVGH